MCGIFAIFNRHTVCASENQEYLTRRGPDDYRKIIDLDGRYCMTFHRLAITGIKNGMQPFQIPMHSPSEENFIMLVCNGEIYNYKKLIRDYRLNVNTDSDCEVIAHLYKKFGIEQTVQLLDGEFAFVLYDSQLGMVHFGRDYTGVKPLYMAYTAASGKFSNIELCSVISGLVNGNPDNSKTHVEPGSIYSYDLNNKTLTADRYAYLCYRPVRGNDLTTVYCALQEATYKRILPTDVNEIGFFLSGGLDSTILLCMALEYYHKHNLFNKIKVHVFSFAFDANAPDMLAAKSVVAFLREAYSEDKTADQDKNEKYPFTWHPVIANISDGLDALHSVIECIETYDTTTVRASTPMYLLSQYIKKQTNVRVVISGEGSDELFGGYLYFTYAPNDQEFRGEILNLLHSLHYYDALRADRTTAYFGLEVRPPFLDLGLLKTVVSCPYLKKGALPLSNPNYQGDSSLSSSSQNEKGCSNQNALPLSSSSQNEKGCSNQDANHSPSVDAPFLTKQLLRAAIAHCNPTLIPEHILYGKKEAFSDAVSLSWVDSIAEYAAQYVANHGSQSLSPYIRATTDEAKMYQNIYYEIHGGVWGTLHKLWLPKKSWVDVGDEPSARVLPIYG